MHLDLFPDGQEYEKETYEEFLIRYCGFGKEIYNHLKSHLPYIYNRIVLYKAVRSTGTHVGDYPYLEDSYAYFDDGNFQFEIQLDPLTEVICLCNFKTQIEIGHWSDNEYEDALAFIEQNFLPNTLKSRLLKIIKRVKNALSIFF